MYLNHIRIQNYKSFLETVDIELANGINLIVGQNNVGKTAFLELLSGSISEKPHLNKRQKPRQDSKLKPYLWAAGLEIVVSAEELKNLIEDKSFDGIYAFQNKLIQYPKLMYVERQAADDDGEHYIYNALVQANYDTEEYDYPSGLEQYLKEIAKSEIVVKCGTPNMRSYLKNIYESKNEVYQSDSGNIEVVYLDKKGKVVIREISTDYEVSKIITKAYFENHVYKFDIHRTIRGEAVTTDSRKLNPNCTNLSSVLDAFQSNPKKFNLYKSLVREVFPSIRDISIDKQADSPIRIWMPQSDSLHLTIPVSDCGTGVGQVLAMLYVIVSSDTPQVVIIDEPNSFLHPSASRKLIEIFKKFNQHQYFISTHSPELISGAKPDKVLLLSLNDEGQTLIQEIDSKDSKGMLNILENIGSKLSDVFGYESILWVEGPTEEQCFPLIVEKLLEKSMILKPILKVKNTGDFEKKHIQTTLDLYNRLVNGNALIPPSSAFIFDKENRSDKDLGDLKKEGKGKIHFLGRRLYENYLLNSSAIASILNKYSSECEWKDKEFSKNQIEQFFLDEKGKKEYWDDKTPTKDKLDKWRNEIHAAKLLDKLFNHFSDSMLPYRKTTHSKELTQWLIDNKPDELQELKALLSEFY